ncbi:MAG: WcaI family glycosyltransferase [Colwellia sp.]|nr:WcaI family glycosyltransferase [Colwellia sp.]
MKILIYSLNYSPELTGIGKYNGELAPALVKRGIEAHVVTAIPYYPEWQCHKGFKNKWSKKYSVDGVYIYRCPLYIPKKVTTFSRLIHLFSFSFSSLLRLITLLRLKPDALFLVQPTLFCAPAALLYCKITGAKAIMHIQDFEIDAMFGLGMGNTGRLKTVIYAMEKWLLKRFDVVSSISYSMLEKAHAKGVKKEDLLFFPNWADTDFITPNISGTKLRTEWGFEQQDKIILYSGNLGKKQGLEIVISAAEALIHRSELKFVIIGNGAYSDTLQQMAKDKNLINVYFKPLQPWRLMPEILAAADVHLVVQRAGAADAVLPSKLTNILSAGGHALVTTEPDTELGKIAEKYPLIYNCVEPENLEAFINKLIECTERNTRLINKEARKYAVENLNLDRVIDRFVDDLKIKVFKSLPRGIF